MNVSYAIVIEQCTLLNGRKGHKNFFFFFGDGGGGGKLHTRDIELSITSNTVKRDQTGIPSRL